ncbi:hypothetical protein C9374_013611 [Naegleria lovaniensis]|uniref:Adenylate and Guanylate cyclase catalytic domain containing protein n=1 Tax=Naegleria lovaniensis TaxID=51637 RepID=A0AA88KAZ4_NAELO|nr:uncharacterized protein C9374_013611 [Naegleria lovaniensis]KAG2372710.1 hypothetical protein C9374_013611 [Naegleria lovaniensis]
MDLLPYYGAVGISSAGLFLLFMMFMLYIVGRKAALDTSSMVVYLRKVLHALSFIIILFSAPIAFIFSSFFDCSYGFPIIPHATTAGTIILSNSTQPSSLENGGMNLNRFPMTSCFSSDNIIMWTISLIGMIALLAVTVLSSCIIPHMHPLSTSLFKSDSLLFRVSFLACNIVSITIHYLIPPQWAFARSAVHIAISMGMAFLVFKTIPMMRRWENSLLFAITLGRVGTSLGGLISHLANTTLSNEFGIAMTMMTIGFMALFFVAGFVSMELYTRIVFSMFKSRYFNPQDEDNGGERELLQLYHIMEENKHLPLLYLYLKFSMTSSNHDDLLHGINLIRGVTSLKAFNDIHSLIVSALIVAYFIPDEVNSSSFAQALLKKAIKQRPHIFLKFLIGQKKKEIEVYTTEVIKTNGSMELNSTLFKVEKKIKELTAIHRHFFKELMQEIVSYEKAERMMMRCAVLEGECDSIFKNVLKLFNNNKTVLRMYAQYLEAFKFNKQLAQEFYMEASSIEEEESVRKRVIGFRNSGTKKLAKKTNRASVVHPESEENPTTLQDSDKRFRSNNSITVSVHSRNATEEKPPDMERANSESSFDLTGVDTLNNEAKRELTYRSTLSTPSSRAIQLGLFLFFIALSFLLVTASLVIGYFISHEVTDHVTTARSACAPVMGLTTILVNTRGFQLVQNFGSESLAHDVSTQLFLDIEENKEMMKEMMSLAMELRSAAYDSKFSDRIYGVYHGEGFPVLIPQIEDHSIRVYNVTAKENATIADINSMIIEATKKLLQYDDIELKQTLTSYEFMLLHRNFDTFTHAYEKFCGMFMASSQNDALELNHTYITYTSISLSIYVVFSIFYMIFMRFDLVIVKKQIKLLQKFVTRNEIGKIYHALGKRVGDETTIHISKAAYLKPKNLFIILTMAMAFTVTLSCVLFLEETLANTNYSVQSYSTIRYSYHTLTFIQHIAFYVTEIFSSKVAQNQTQLLTPEELEFFHDDFNNIIASVREYWGLCLYGSDEQSGRDKRVIGLFPETDEMIKGNENCTLEQILHDSTSRHNFSCVVGVDSTISDIVLKSRKLLEDVQASDSSMWQNINFFMDIAFLTSYVSQVLIKFSDVFALASSEPKLELFTAVAVLAFTSLVVLLFGLVNSMSLHAKTTFTMRMMFNYISLETIEANERLKNYVLYHSLISFFEKLSYQTDSDSSDAKLISILNASVEGVVLCNSTLGMEIVNPASLRMFGYQSEDVIGKPLVSLFEKNKQDTIRKEIESMKASVTEHDSKGETFDVDCIRKNQTLFPCKVTIFVSVFQKKQIVTCFLKDVTSEKKQNSLLAEEKKNSEKLLLNILPEEVATQLKNGISLIAEKFTDVTCFFSDMVNFTAMSSTMSPSDLVQMLNIIVNGFDDLTDTYEIEKIKTIGDAYFCAGGLFNSLSDHPERVLRFSMDTFSVIRQFNSKLMLEFYGNENNVPPQQINIRCGINTGGVIAGVIGKKKFAFDLWGDTINVASRMESTSKPGRVRISRSTYERVHDLGFTFVEEKTDVKGKGLTQTYLLNACHHVCAILTSEEINTLRSEKDDLSVERLSQTNLNQLDNANENFSKQSDLPQQ